MFLLGSVSVYFFGVLTGLAFIIGSFVLWRQLKDDYSGEEIVSFTLLFTFFSLLGARLVYLADHFSSFSSHFSQWFLLTRFPGFSLVGAFLGGVLFSFYWSRKKEWGFWVLGDAVVRALVWVVLLGSLGALLSDVGNLIIYRVILAVLVFSASFFIARRYRRFIWYKSGKPGFIACSITVFYFLGSLLLDFSTKNILYLEVTVSWVFVLLGLGFFYRQSGRVFGEDVEKAILTLKKIKKIKKITRK